MAWNLSQSINGRAYQHQSVSIEDRNFWLVPKDSTQAQATQPELLKYEDPRAKRFYEYKYKPLPRDKKRIRLLKLLTGENTGTDIYCELIEVDYDNDFHIPLKPQQDMTQGEESRSRHDNSTNRDNIDSGERSDLETHWQEKMETETEKNARKQRQEERELKRKMEEQQKGSKTQRREKEQKEENEKVEMNFRKWKQIKSKEVEYEALSWCWGDEEEDYTVLIVEGFQTYRKRVRRELALALKYLRRGGRQRVLWVDAICIDQSNPSERNHQVQMMSRVYTRARQVCIWLGEADLDSEIAIRFIKSEMKELKNFDTISSDESYSRKWQALMSLMQRDWFFRRWVVQEIALARAATVYCGALSVPWKSFAVAVELFVEVETATHRLSEVMKRDEKFRHVPGWFEYVSELGASLLVQATGKVFRSQRNPMQQDPETTDEETEGRTRYKRHEGGRDRKRKRREEKEKEEDDQIRVRLREAQTIDPLERRSLLSLEYLVSTMYIFKASEPRDVVYALLAIARDAAPFAPAQVGQDDQKLFLVMTLLDRFLAEKPFVVDYDRSYSDVTRDFVGFSIARMQKNDPTRALDILCRPWALEPPRGRSIRKHDANDPQPKRLLPKRQSWKIRKSAVQRREGPYQINDPDWQQNGRSFKYKYIKNVTPVSEPDPRSNDDYRSQIMEKGKWKGPCTRSMCNHEEGSDCAGPDWKAPTGWEDIKARYFSSDKPSDKDQQQAEQDIPIPSWVGRTSQAPFMLDHAPGMEMRKTSRANADPLVGSPLDGHRNYSAAGSETVKLDILKFRKRPVMRHYSLYVKGFELDVVKDVEDASQLGSIPRSWLERGGWTELEEDPPDEFWRTIVADRGQDNRNPPYYYARACKESVHKGGHLGGSVNTMALIHDEQNSIIAEFCRRVHAVIWNRCLFRTKNNRLGLAHRGVKEGDKVCILYGSTVPVILRQNTKETTKYNEHHEVIEKSDISLEDEEDSVESLKSCIRRAKDNRKRKAKYRPRKNKYKKEEWEEMMDARQAYLEERREEKEAAQNAAEVAEKAKKEREATKSKPGGGPDEEGSSNGGSQAGPSGSGNSQGDNPDKDKNSWYEFKGECYLHGMMDGEAMREKFYQDLDDCIFELR